MDKNTCSHCKFFDPDKKEHDEWGWCHRYPPKWEYDDYYVPHVSHIQWCGEFKRKE